MLGDLNEEIAERVQQLVVKDFNGIESIAHLVNNVLVGKIDYEHVLTFLDHSSSRHHRDFADGLREIFADVLGERLEEIRKVQDRVPDDLYFALLDMYEVQGLDEELKGFLT